MLMVAFYWQLKYVNQDLDCQRGHQCYLILCLALMCHHRRLLYPEFLQEFGVNLHLKKLNEIRFSSLTNKINKAQPFFSQTIERTKKNS